MAQAIGLAYERLETRPNLFESMVLVDVEALLEVVAGVLS